MPQRGRSHDRRTPTAKHIDTLVQRMLAAVDSGGPPAGVDAGHARVEAAITVLAVYVAKLDPPPADRAAYVADIGARLAAKPRVPS